MGTRQAQSTSHRAIFKSKDSSTYSDGVGSGDVIGPKDWTEDKTSKRQLDPGEKRTLEIKFTDKFKDANAGGFGGAATFAEGCAVGL